MNRQELTEEAIKEVQKKKEKEGESSSDEAGKESEKRKISMDAFRPRKSMDKGRAKEPGQTEQSAYP